MSFSHPSPSDVPGRRRVFFAWRTRGSCRRRIGCSGVAMSDTIWIASAPFYHYYVDNLALAAGLCIVDVCMAANAQIESD